MLTKFFPRSLSLAVAAMASSSAMAEIAWQENLQEAHAEATASGKPLLLHFYGDNCPWCDKLEAGAFASPEVAQAIEQNFIAVKVHTGKNQKLVKSFQVRQIPYDVVVTPSGRKLVEGTSKQDPSEFVAVLAQALNAPTQTQTPTQIAVQTPAAPIQPAAPTQFAAPAGLASMADYYAGDAAIQGGASQPSYTSPTTPPMAADVPANLAAAVAAPAAGVGLPPSFAGGAVGQLAGVRTEGLSLEMPNQVTAGLPGAAATVTPSEPARSAKSSQQPELALDGFCAVTLMADARWEEGKPQYGVIHLGKLYLFTSESAMQTFLADPVAYTPVLNEIDVVRFFEDRVIVPGKRNYGMRINDRMFFFEDEAALEHFQREWERYFDAAITVMENAIHDANPDA